MKFQWNGNFEKIGWINMLSIAHKHKMHVLILSIVVIYALQFLVFPKCLPQYYPVSNEARSILIIPLIVFSVLTNTLIDVNIGRWAIVDIIYCVMVLVYNGMGFYGIGKRGLSIDGMAPSYSFELAVITILIITLVLFFFQMLVQTIRLVYLKIKK